ncbi:YceI family protein [Amycolatopsis minnesotensis]|uniref:YceI family protein n=1 Tax=Amycolatopsis minnesotensis TaxID=337894 RepID=A0ABP5BUN5_9PSEU
MSITIPPAGEYTIDPGRSAVTFATRHFFGLGGVRGSFGLASGRLTVAEPVEESTVAAAIDAGSFKTGSGARDRVVKSKQYLESERFPEIRFASAGVREQDGEWVLDGTLTVKDSTQPVRLTVDEVAAEAGTITAHAHVRIDRYAFGVTAQKGMTGRHLDLALDITAVPA